MIRKKRKTLTDAELKGDDDSEDVQMGMREAWSPWPGAHLLGRCEHRLPPHGPVVLLLTAAGTGAIGDDRLQRRGSPSPC